MRARLIHLLPYFVRYLTIGGSVFCLDIGSFQFMLTHGVHRPLATTLSFALAIATHFTLNRHLNFRNYDRPGRRQFQTYLVVSFVLWLVTMVVIEVGVAFGLKALYGKLLAVAINIPIGFLGHKYLTFGPGLVYWMRRILGRPIEDLAEAADEEAAPTTASPEPTPVAAGRP